MNSSHLIGGRLGQIRIIDSETVLGSVKVNDVFIQGFLWIDAGGLGFPCQISAVIFHLTTSQCPARRDRHEALEPRLERGGKKSGDSQNL